MAFITVLVWLVALTGLSAAAPNAIPDVESKVIVADFADIANARSGERIVGGTATTVNQYPTIIQLDFFRSNAWGQSCGANIITNNVILSAAHCTHSYFDPWYSPQNRRIRAGATNRNTGGIIINVQSVLNHHDFNPPNVNADICILRLAGSLTFGNTIQQVAIVPQNYNVPDNTAVVHAGWGAMWTNGPSSSTLLHVTVYMLNHSTCVQRYSPTPVTNNMICTWASGRDACQGDSGGPLYQVSSNPVTSALVGIVSWGFDCADPFFPGVSARVGSYSNWIVQNA